MSDRTAERRAREERDQAVLDGFIERYKALADECGVFVSCGYQGEAYFGRGLALVEAP